MLDYENTNNNRSGIPMYGSSSVIGVEEIMEMYPEEVLGDRSKMETIARQHLSIPLFTRICAASRGISMVAERVLAFSETGFKIQTVSFMIFFPLVAGLDQNP